MPICLFEDAHVPHLAPLTDTRAVFDLRLGAFTIAEGWQHLFPEAIFSGHTRPLVADVTAQEYPDWPINAAEWPAGTLFINGRVVPEAGAFSTELRAHVQAGKPAHAWVSGDILLAAWHPDPVPFAEILTENLPQKDIVEIPLISRLWDPIVGLHDQLMRDADGFGFPALGAEEWPTTFHPSVQVVAAEEVFAAPDVTVRAGAVLNAEAGPIMLDRGAVIMENAVVRGPCYIGPKSQIKMAARVETVAIGPQCKVGGEVHDAILHSCSNKAHDGFLGHSYLGRWCNLGADTNTSNLKNDYGIVSLYNAVLQDFEASGQQFLGLIMGDHAKCGINTMFNTGTVVGVFCNIYGGGFPPRHMPAFSWGGADGFVPYRLEKALRVAEAVMARRGISLTNADQALLTKLATSP